MSTGSTFQLIVNEGSKQDHYLTFSDKLVERMLAYRRINLINTLINIVRKSNKTGGVQLNVDQLRTTWGALDSDSIIRHAIGLGINSPSLQDVAVQPTLAQISQTHVLHMYSHFKPFVSLGFEYERVNASGNMRFASTPGDNDAKLKFVMSNKGTFMNDCVLHLQLTGISGTRNNPLVAVDMVKYADMLGHRIAKEWSYTVNNNPLDKYDSDDANVYYAYSVPHEKRNGYLRCIGQEIPHVGYLTPEPRTDQFRQTMLVSDGNQTLTLTKPVIDLWIPALFWFRDPKQSIPGVAVPYGQSDITVTLASVSEFVACVEAVSQTASQQFTAPTISIAEMYVKHINVNPEISDVVMKRVGFSLIRVHRRQDQNISLNSGEILLSEMKWPLEKLFVAFRPVVNSVDVDYWHYNSSIALSTITTPVWTTIPAPAIATNNIVYPVETQTVNQLSLRAHGNVMYPLIDSEFYNHYMPYANGGSNWGTPRDPGWYLFLFCLNPDEYQPSGHLNTSKARELYLAYESSFIGTANVVRVLIRGEAINFLLTADGSSLIHYNT